MWQNQKSDLQLCEICWIWPLSSTSWLHATLFLTREMRVRTKQCRARQCLGMPSVACPESTVSIQRAGGHALDSKEAYGWTRASQISPATDARWLDLFYISPGHEVDSAFLASEAISQNGPIAASTWWQKSVFSQASIYINISISIYKCRHRCRYRYICRNN